MPEGNFVEFANTCGHTAGGDARSLQARSAGAAANQPVSAHRAVWMPASLPAPVKVHKRKIELVEAC